MTDNLTNDPNAYLRDLQRIEREQELAKLRTLSIEFTGVLDYFPKLREELEAFHHAEGVAFDGLSDRLRPTLKQAANLQFEIEHLPAELCEASEMQVFMQRFKQAMGLQFAEQLMWQFNGIRQSVRQRLVQEKEVAERQIREKVEAERRARERVEAERKARERADIERAERKRWEAECRKREAKETRKKTMHIVWNALVGSLLGGAVWLSFSYFNANFIIGGIGGCIGGGFVGVSTRNIGIMGGRSYGVRRYFGHLLQGKFDWVKYCIIGGIIGGVISLFILRLVLSRE